MQYYYSCAIILLLCQQYHGQEKVDEVTVKNPEIAVEELLKKINEISKQTFAKADNEAKLEMLRKVEEKLKRAGKSLGNKGERYVKLIMKAIKARALTYHSSNNTSKTQMETRNYDENIPKFVEKIDTLNEKFITKISIESNSDTEKTYDLGRTPKNTITNQKNETDIEYDQMVHSLFNEHLRRMKIDTTGSNKRYIRRNNTTREVTTKRFIQRSTPRYECEGSLDKICLNIKEMRQLKCHFDDSVVSIEKLCDGSTDCVDRTDEKFCTSQVTERIRNANQVIYKIDESYQIGCFLNNSEESIMTDQIIVLRSVLQSQEKFVEKYKHFNLSLIPNSEFLEGEGAIKRAVNELSLIISSLSLALDAEICSQQVKNVEEFTARKFNDLLVEDFDKLIDEVEWPPKSCVCKRERCENMATCTDACKRICWQKYSLTRWGCPSINETENVPMSVICDGKFDCFDQSDEKDCVTGKSFAKYEAHKIFEEILTSLSMKVTSREFAFIRNMLLSLHSTIEDLQKFCMASEPDLKIIRILRNKSLSALSEIYSETLAKSAFLYQKSEVYLFLLSLNEKIINALKRSNTGNNKIIANNGCYCRNGQCSMPICSRNCVRSCIAEPRLTRYFCDNSSNKSISLDDICNGKANCPKEDDETLCETEVCRRHHLSLLRLGLQKIGKKQEGTSMGELLTAWKIKVSSTILIAENSYRPNPNTIRDIIRDILNDLVITYGAVNDYRRDNEYALEQFTNIARYVMQFLRSCAY